MKIERTSLLVLLSTLLTLAINGLANALPLNGLTTGEISDVFEVYFVPAAYVFSIWGLIYLGLLAFAIYQALPAQQTNPRLTAIRPWAILANLANGVWIFLWHYEQFPLTLIAMLTLLAALLAIYGKLRPGRTLQRALEHWLVDRPFSVYLGWITVATIANVSDVLDYVGWKGFGLSEAAWMVIMLGVVAIVGWAMSLREHDIFYLGVLLWALAGIGVRFPDVALVSPATWSAFAAVSLAFLWALIGARVTGAEVSRAKRDESDRMPTA